MLLSYKTGWPNGGPRGEWSIRFDRRYPLTKGLSNETSNKILSIPLYVAQKPCKLNMACDYCTFKDVPFVLY